MTVDLVVERLLNPGVALAMIGSGLAYAILLWALAIQPLLRLWVVAVAPGTVFLAMVWATRAAQGGTTVVYLAMFVLWLLFANSAFVAVAANRWRLRR